MQSANHLFFSRENQPTWNNKHMLSFLKHVIIMTKQTSSMRGFWLTLTSAVMNKSNERKKLQESTDDGHVHSFFMLLNT